MKNIFLCVFLSLISCLHAVAGNEATIFVSANIINEPCSLKNEKNNIITYCFNTDEKVYDNDEMDVNKISKMKKDIIKDSYVLSGEEINKNVYIVRMIFQ